MSYSAEWYQVGADPTVMPAQPYDPNDPCTPYRLLLDQRNRQYSQAKTMTIQYGIGGIVLGAIGALLLRKAF